MLFVLYTHYLCMIFFIRVLFFFLRSFFPCLFASLLFLQSSREFSERIKFVFLTHFAICRNSTHECRSQDDI